jgi:hypothetical protein
MSEYEQLFRHVHDVTQSLRHTQMRLKHHQTTGDVELSACTERVVQAMIEEKYTLEKRLKATPRN